LPTRWYGYLPVQLWLGGNSAGQQWERVLLSMPEDSFDSLLDLTVLRGQRIRVQRVGSRTGPVAVAVLDGPVSDQVLPPCFDVEGSLRRLWGLRRSAPARPAGGQADGQDAMLGYQEECDMERGVERDAQPGDDLVDGL
jgi:hypothetical protein